MFARAFPRQIELDGGVNHVAGGRILLFSLTGASQTRIILYGIEK
jgi:hypothetical protein